MGVQTALALEDQDEAGEEDVESDSHLLLQALDLRRRSISLNDIIGSSFIHESASGERIIVSRGWPVAASGALRRRNNHQSRRRRSRSQSRSSGNLRQLNEDQKRRLLVEFLRSAPTLSHSNSFMPTSLTSSKSDVESALKIGRPRSSRNYAPNRQMLKLSVRPQQEISTTARAAKVSNGLAHGGQRDLEQNLDRRLEVAYELTDQSALIESLAPNNEG